MMQGSWSGTGHRFHASWGGVAHTLALDARQPGLGRDGADGIALLSIESVATPAGRVEGACGLDQLREVRCRGPLVTALYALPALCRLWVQASWRLRDPATVDLELEVLTESVAELSALEVIIATRLEPVAGPAPVRVLPRDAGSAALSYDGRETGAERLSTEPPGGLMAAGPWVWADSQRPGWQYIEMAHPHDESRRIMTDGGSVRHACFGYDLEKGVVLRGRFRGIWSDQAATADDQERLFQQFVAQPLPLTR